jgi:hypothetical protein
MPRTKGDIKCECGGTYSESTKQQHETTKRHLKHLQDNIDQVVKRERKEEYYVDGAFSYKNYYHSNKTKYNKSKPVLCECGRMVLDKTIKAHKMKPIHIKTLELQNNNINKDEIL